jgi:hypothetical protein
MSPSPRHARRHAAFLRRLPVLGAAALLLVGGGSGLLAAAFSDVPAAADSPLGGFTVSSLAEAVTAQYEQPNFPLPATPSLEFDEGYATTTDNYGPTGSALASTLYPGQVVANAGPQLALLVPGVPLPPAPVWPVQAVSNYPSTPSTPSTASTDQPGITMDSTSSANGNTASATLGDGAPTAGANGADPSSAAPSGSGNPFASASPFIGIGGLSATSSSNTPQASAEAQATATVTGISILAGFIEIGSVTSTATATSDGTTGKVTGSTVVQNVDIAGEQVTVGANGITAVGQSSPTGLPIAALNTLLNELGITMSVNNATDTVQGPSAKRVLDGLKISVNLQTLDDAANKFASLFPPSLTSQLPVAIPNDQILTLDLGALAVSSTASPPFTANSGNSGAGGSSASTAPFSSASTSAGSTGFSGNSGGGSSFSPTGGTGTGTATGTSSPGTGTTQPTTGEPLSTLTGASFKGIGALLVLLGLLAAGSLAYLYKRADDASELVGSACADGDPLAERFADADELPADFGGFS